MNSVVSLINCFNESRNICCKRIIFIQLAYNLYTRNHYYQNSRNKAIALPVNSIAMVKAHSQVRFKFYAMHRVLSLLLILNRFHVLFPCFHCWLWTSTWLLGRNTVISQLWQSLGVIGHYLDFFFSPRISDQIVHTHTHTHTHACARAHTHTSCDSSRTQCDYRGLTP